MYAMVLTPLESTAPMHDTRQAFELAWASVYTTMGARPRVVAMDDVTFRYPVEVGSLLQLDTQVDLAEGMCYICKITHSA